MNTNKDDQLAPKSSDNGQPVKADREPVNRIDQTVAPPDPFDPASLRLGQDFASSVGVKKVITSVPCRRPSRQEFFRVRPGDDWRIQTVNLTDEASGDSYTVERSLWPDLGDDIRPVYLFTCLTRQGTLLLWAAKLPGPDGRSNTWNESALRAAEIAERSWIKLVANHAGGMYECHEALGNLSEPEWPDDLEFHDVLRLCFQGRHIADRDHPVLRSLRGEV